MDIHDSVEDKLEIFTSTEMASFEPDNYLRPFPSLEVHNKDTGYICLIDIIPDNQHLFIAKKRIRKYIEHFENGNWDWDEYPDVYLVRKPASDRNRLEKYIENKMDDGYLDENDFVINIISDAAECLF